MLNREEDAVINGQAHLQQVPVVPGQDYGGELQQAHGDGALAEVVLVHLSGTEVGRLRPQLEAPLCCRQLTGGQLGQEEVNGFQKARVLPQALGAEGRGGDVSEPPEPRQ